MIRDLRKRSRLALLMLVAALIANANAEASEPAAQKADGDTTAKQLPANDEKPLPEGALFRVGRGHAGQIAGLGLLASAKTLLTSAKDDTIGLWDLESGKTLGRIVAPHARPKSIAVSPDGSLLTILAPDGKLQMRELPSGKLVKEWQAQTTKSTGSVAFSPDGKKVASSGMSTTIWDVATAKPLHQLDHPPEAMSALAFSPGGQILATGSAKGMIRLWDAVTGKEFGQLAGHSKYVDQVAFSADEQLLASVSHDDSVRLWRLDTRSELKKFKVEYGVALAFSRDGRSLAAGGGEGIIRIWETASGKERATYDSNNGCVMALLFSPTGERLISGHVETAALCWDIAGRGLTPLKAKALSADNVDKEWQQLSSDNPRQAFQVIWRLIGVPQQAVAKARNELQPANAGDDKSIAKHIADLDADNFVVREKATKELKKLGDQAWPALRHILAKDASAESKERASQILALQFEAPIERLRIVRALEVLEHINNADARGVVTSLAKGAPQSWLTQDAARTLLRMMSAD